MLMRLGTVALCLFLYAAEECGAKSGGGQGQAAATPAASPATAAPASPAAAPAAAEGAKGVGKGSGACALLEAAEVEAVQGGRVAAARPAEVARGPLAVSQCHYAVTAPDKPGQNLAVLIEVRTGTPAELAAEWEKLGAKKENKRSERPRPVEGVGRGAYWVGNDRLGALYVSAGDRLVYVSLGGPGGEGGEKLEKSKRLALKALARL